VIVEYLDHRAGGGKIIPQESKARFAALRLQALADGMTDAQILLVYEGRFRPPEHHVKKWTDYQADKIKRGLTTLEADPPSLDPLPNVGQIALACFLGHRDLRVAGDWRAAHPKLVTWLDRFAAKVPAFAETKVAA
jgi:glutathione S-transferase